MGLRLPRAQEAAQDRVGIVRRRLAARREEGLEATGQYEVDVVHKSGRIIPTHATASTINLPDGPATIGFFQDISEQRRIADSLRLSEARFRTLFDEVPAIADLARRLGAYCYNPFILVPTGRGEEITEEILEPRQYAELLADLLQLRSDLGIELRVTCGPQYARLFREMSAELPKVHVSGCMGGRGFGFISHRGDVQTCGFLDISAGNLVENGYDFAAIWDRSPFLNAIRDLPAYKGRLLVYQRKGCDAPPESPSTPSP